MWLGFVIAAPRVFFSDLDIYRAFAETTPQFGIVALSLTFVVITGEIDLSFPSVMALGTAAFCLVTAHAGAPWWVGLICALATGAVCGLVNGLLVASLNIPSLVITIGTQFLFRGLELVLMGGTGVPLTADQYPQMHALLRESYVRRAGPDAVDGRHPDRRMDPAQPHPVRRACLPRRRQPDQRAADGRQRRPGEDQGLRAGRRHRGVLPD